MKKIVFEKSQLFWDVTGLARIIANRETKKKTNLGTLGRLNIHPDLQNVF